MVYVVGLGLLIGFTGVTIMLLSHIADTLDEIKNKLK